MLDLIDHPVAEDHTWTCDIDSVTIPEAEGVVASSKPADSNPDDEDMDTAEKKLPKLCNDALLKKFGNFCKLANLVTMVSDGYSKPMLSNRLQGSEVKEGLCITVYLKHLHETPDMRVPPILPRAILDHSEEALGDRLTYLGLFNEEDQRGKERCQAKTACRSLPGNEEAQALL